MKYELERKSEETMQNLYAGIRDILLTARNKVYRAANSEMVQAYWNIGRLIVEHEQNGNTRAEYGKEVLNTLAKRLTAEFGKGFTSTNLKYMRQFYQAFPIGHTLCDQLTWSHYRLLMRVEMLQLADSTRMNVPNQIGAFANSNARSTAFTTNDYWQAGIKTTCDQKYRQRNQAISPKISSRIPTCSNSLGLSKIQTSMKVILKRR